MTWRDTDFELTHDSAVTLELTHDSAASISGYLEPMWLQLINSCPNGAHIQQVGGTRRVPQFAPKLFIIK